MKLNDTYYHVKQRIFELLHEEFQKPHDWFGRFIVKFITFLIIFNVIAIILESIESLAEHYEVYFWAFEVFSITIFTTEYLCSVWTANNNPEYSGTIKGRIRYVFSIMGLIDLFAILPFYVHAIAPVLFPFDLRIIRIFRMFRIFHLFTLGHYNDAFDTIGEVIKEKKESLILTMFIGTVILLFCSILIYDLEVQANQHEFGDLFMAMYWVGITLARLKQGELFPVTPGGQIVAGFVEILGVMFFILPTGIIASGFMAHLQHPHATKFPDVEKKICALLEVTPTTKYQKIQARIHHLFELHHENDRWGIFIGYSIGILIILNLIAAMLETLIFLSPEWIQFLRTFEGISVIVFTVEYLLRLWSCNWRETKYINQPIIGRIKFMVEPLSIIDVVALLPFYIPIFIGFELTFIRIFRLLRFLRLFKFGRYSETLESIWDVFRKSKAALTVSVFIGAVFWIFISTIIYHVENEFHPEEFNSIPETMLWLVLSFTSFGGGQTIPVTFIGRLFSVIGGFFGMALLALPTGILGAAFVEELDKHHPHPMKMLRG